MKLFFMILGALLLVIGPFCLIAQSIDTTGIAENPFPDGTTSVGQLVSMFDVLYGALVIVWGYIGKALNLKSKVPNYVFVVLAGGVVLAVAFVALGFSQIFPLIFSFLSAIGVYDLLFKPVTRALVRNTSN